MANSENNIFESVTLPDGAYFDDDEMLHYPNGELMPDGVYRTQDGEVFMYEGNFAAKLASLPE